MRSRSGARRKAARVAARSPEAIAAANLVKASQAKEEPLQVHGTVRQVFPSTTFAVELENGMTILSHIAGRLRRHRIRILPGDRVDVEMSPYDLTKGRITYRYRAGEPKR